MNGIRPLVLLLEASSSDADVQAHAAFALKDISKANGANQQVPNPLYIWA